MTTPIQDVAALNERGAHIELPEFLFGALGRDGAGELTFLNLPAVLRLGRANRLCLVTDDGRHLAGSFTVRSRRVPIDVERDGFRIFLDPVEIISCSSSLAA